jgi:hypothetical protein
MLHRWPGRLVVLVAVLGCALVGGCDDEDDGEGGGDSKTFPESWAGIWDFEGDVMACGTDSVLTVMARTDTLCAGAPFEFILDEDLGLVLSCDGTITDTAANLNCQGTFPFQGVTCSAAAQVVAVRNGDVFTGSATVNVTYSGDPPLPPDFCLEQEFTATRTSTAQPGCDAAAPPAWLRLPPGSRVGTPGENAGATE